MFITEKVKEAIVLKTISKFLSKKSNSKVMNDFKNALKVNIAINAIEKDKYLKCYSQIDKKLNREGIMFPTNVTMVIAFNTPYLSFNIIESKFYVVEETLEMATSYEWDISFENKILDVAKVKLDGLYNRTYNEAQIELDKYLEEIYAVDDVYPDYDEDEYMDDPEDVYPVADLYDEAPEFLSDDCEELPYTDIMNEYEFDYLLGLVHDTVRPDIMDLINDVYINDSRLATIICCDIFGYTTNFSEKAKKMYTNIKDLNIIDVENPKELVKKILSGIDLNDADRENILRVTLPLIQQMYGSDQVEDILEGVL